MLFSRKPETIDNTQVIAILNSVNGSLALSEIDGKKAITTAMLSYAKQMAKVNQDFYTTTINSDPNLLEAVKKVLASLAIDKRLEGRYINSSLTVHELLKELTQFTIRNDDNTQKLELLSFLVNDIENKAKISRQKAISIMLTLLFPIIALLPFGGYGFVAQIITAALFVPVVSIIGAAGLGLYSIYQTTFDKNIPLLTKIRENFFVITRAAMSIAAYSLTIVAAASAAHLITVFTLFAAGIYAIHQGVNLLYVQKTVLDQALDDKDLLSTQQRNARYEIADEKIKRQLTISFSASVILVVLAAVSCFAPGGVMVMMPVVAATLLTYGMEYRINKQLEKLAKKELYGKFEGIEHAALEKEKRLLAANAPVIEHPGDTMSISDDDKTDEISSGYGSDESLIHSRWALFSEDESDEDGEEEEQPLTVQFR